MVNPKKLETGLRPNSAGIPYALLLRIEAIGFPTFGLLLYGYFIGTPIKGSTFWILPKIGEKNPCEVVSPRSARAVPGAAPLTKPRTK